MYKFNLGGIILPVTPSKITYKINNTNKTLDLVNGDEINILRTPGLMDISFEFMLPAVKYPFAYYESGFVEPHDYLVLIKKLKYDKKPFVFSIFRTLPSGKVLFSTSKDVSLESYTVTEDSSEGFDIMVSVDLKEYIKKETLTSTIVKDSNGNAQLKKEETRMSDKSIPKSYTVKKGDSLWAICKVQLGDGNKYKEIAELNGISNPNLIYPGQVIKFG